MHASLASTSHPALAGARPRVVVRSPALAPALRAAAPLPLRRRRAALRPVASTTDGGEGAAMDDPWKVRAPACGRAWVCVCVMCGGASAGTLERGPAPAELRQSALAAPVSRRT